MISHVLSKARAKNFGVWECGHWIVFSGQERRVQQGSTLWDRWCFFQTVYAAPHVTYHNKQRKCSNKSVFCRKKEDEEARKLAKPKAESDMSKNCSDPSQVTFTKPDVPVPHFSGILCLSWLSIRHLGWLSHVLRVTTHSGIQEEHCIGKKTWAHECDEYYVKARDGTFLYMASAN